MTTRRGLLIGAASLFAAPAIVRAGILMPIKPEIITANYMSFEYLRDDGVWAGINPYLEGPQRGLSWQGHCLESYWPKVTRIRELFYRGTRQKLSCYHSVVRHQSEPAEAALAS